MPKVDQATREGRKERVFLTLRRYPAGLSEAELEQVTGFERRTLNNYLRELETEGKVYKDGVSWAALPYDQVQLRKFDLSPEEAMTLYLATRLLVKQHDKRNEAAESALMKLAAVLIADAEVGHEIHQAALELAHRPDSGEYYQTFRKVMQAYIFRRVMHITYEPARGRPFETDFSPYLIEPSAIGYTTYVIGHSSIVNNRRTYKMERIRSATLTRQEYRIPPDFPGLEILRSAWSIIYGEQTRPVLLRFSPNVYKRVMETRWHPSEDKKDDPDRPGHLLWKAEVADTTDMMPWIRGWGADCEVLEPKELQDRIIDHLRYAAKLYKLTDSLGQTREGDMDVFQQYLTLLGKTDPKSTIFEHSSDVYQVAEYLLAENKDAVQKPMLVKAGALFHDVGKIEQDRTEKRWIHQPHSQKYLRSLIDHPRMQALLADNQIDLNQINYEDLILICEHHHDIPTQPSLLRRSQDALLVSVADVIASALEAGWLGEIRAMLTAGTYINLNLSLLENLSLAGGLDSEIHRVDLPGNSTSDALLNELIFRDMVKRLREQGLKAILQKRNSLWVVGTLDALRAFLSNYQVEPRSLYQSANLSDEVYEQILAHLPTPGSLSVDSLKYLLVNEKMARKVALSLVDRRTAREALEHFDISAREVHEAFGSRGRTVADKLEAVGDALKYLLVGAYASYRYHRWQVPPSDRFEVLVAANDFDTWYAYLRDNRIYVSQTWPTGSERDRFAEAVSLSPTLTEALWESRVMQDNLALISPVELVFRLLGEDTENSVAESMAILVRQRVTWDWDAFGRAIEARRVSRQMGCLLEIINHEAGKEIMAQSLIERLAAKIHIATGESSFIFPKLLGNERSTIGVPKEYLSIGQKWGLELRLPRHLVAKVLEDLGV